MRILPRHLLFIAPLLMALATSCASVKTLDVWKDESTDQRLQKVLVIAVAELDFMKEHFENVLSNQLASRGIEAVPANRVFPRSAGKLRRKDVLAKVREMGIGTVLVARPVDKEETERLHHDGVYVVPAGYGEWYGFYSGSFDIAAGSAPSSYDAEFFTIVTNIYDVSSERLIWSSLSRVKVENSREGAINPFIDALMKQLEESKLIQKQR